jgi:hypothetical protein
MEKAKLLIKELAELTSTEINFTADNICEIVVEDRLILLRYRPEDNDWLYFGVVLESEELSRETLEKALALNLFGAETLGLHLGLFVQSLILSGTVPMDGLNAEGLAEKLLFLSKCIAKLSEKLQSDDSGAVAPIPSELTFGANLMSV